MLGYGVFCESGFSLHAWVDSRETGQHISGVEEGKRVVSVFFFSFFFFFSFLFPLPFFFPFDEWADFIIRS